MRVLSAAILVATIAWSHSRDARAARVALDPPELVVVRGRSSSADDENRFVERFSAASPVDRAPVRLTALQRELDGDKPRPDALAAGRRAQGEALDAYGRLDAKAGSNAIDRARELLGQALLSRAEAKSAFPLLAQVELTAAAFHVAVGNQGGADAAFEAALGIDAGVRYDAARFSPALARTLDDARARFLRRVPVVTLVTSEPAGADVELAGKTEGVTPLKVRVRPGNRMLVLRRAGFQAVAVPIRGEVPKEVGATLQPTRLQAEWAGWCRGAAGSPIPASLNQKRTGRSLIVVESDGANGFAVCALIGNDVPAFGVRIARDAPAAGVAAFWREHDRVHRRFVLKRLSDSDALDATPISNAPPGIRKDTSRRWYERWWVWAAVGAVVAGSTVGVVLGAKGPSTSGVAIRF